MNPATVSTKNTAKVAEILENFQIPEGEKLENHTWYYMMLVVFNSVEDLDEGLKLFLRWASQSENHDENATIKQWKFFTSNNPLQNEGPTIEHYLGLVNIYESINSAFTENVCSTCHQRVLRRMSG